VSEPPTARCERVRARAALAPDGELSQLERRLLDVHLGHCEDCREFAFGVAVVARELRAARPAPPARSLAPILSRPRLVRVRFAAAAAAVAALALGIAQRAPLPTGGDLPSAPVAGASAVDEQRAFRQHRRAELLASVAAAERAVQSFGDRPA
jgi:predicted anti-sigma-YlaC factor YlaD